MSESHLWVDPEGVSRVGKRYASAAETFADYRRLFETIRATYEGCWGNDDMGKQFSEKFVQGLDSMGGIILAVEGSLSYAAEGLDESGRSYRKADDDAEEAGTTLLGMMETPEQGPPPPPPEAPPDDPTWLYTGSGIPGEENPLPGQQRAFFKSTRPALTEGPGGEPLIALRTVQGRLLEPIEGTEDEPLIALRRERGVLLDPEQGDTTGVLSSSVMFSTTHQGVLIDDRPIPEGFQVLTANEIDDGLVRLDINSFPTITPIGPGQIITGADGQPIPHEDGQQLFLIPVTPPGEVTVPDENYQPNYVDFRADGTFGPMPATP